MPETNYVPDPRPVPMTWPPSLELGGGGGGTGLSGAGSPEGSQIANPGTTYLNTSDNSFWAKSTGSGAVGWIQLIV